MDCIFDKLSLSYLFTASLLPTPCAQHYHGDPYGPSCLYSDANITDNHPAHWGFGLDGPWIFGRYTSSSQVRVPHSWAYIRVLAFLTVTHWRCWYSISKRISKHSAALGREGAESGLTPGRFPDMRTYMLH
jgi:hypothetical protein